MNTSIHRLAKRYEAICAKWQTIAEAEFAAAVRLQNEVSDRLRETEARLIQTLATTSELCHARDWGVVEAFAKRLEQQESELTAESEASAREAEYRREALQARYREAERWKSLRMRLDDAARRGEERVLQAELDEHAVMRGARRSWKPSDLR
ncbi:flagellar FliJ family protein [Alicyclobacillus mali]|uniref:Flagellar FliJ family protein n=1 Tax=Alicyclobacillus mali (ex Roth et al. 2021) TaxID=1123961 RepID=A0ABS0F1Q4_9BACL|nr:flagellar FliJ family protein [Alicyclobacillus mali (ex Roth et al. 2021)]MBF8377241.1 flagellar FliJ family protein [Alicyclobacillus mali (ex Roth et al. 2021)]MCL6488109.1 flagellar FliJ family protein [Alicyclobacillus mali (ex Roth et al. 2021)]